MNSVIRTIAIAWLESGEVQASVVVAHEANGATIWYERAGFGAQLKEFHRFDAAKTRDGVIAAALVRAQRLAKEAEIHGEQFVALRSFTQC